MAVQTVRNESGQYERTWSPTAKQNKFIEIPFEVFEGFFGGSAGPGKSELLFMLPVLYGFHESTDFQGVLFRESFPQLEASLIKRAVPVYNLFGASYDGGKHVCTFPSGAQMRFSYLESDKDARGHDTNEYQYIGFDELTAFNQFRYTYLTSRVRSVIPGIPPIIRSASNPGNVGHLWVRQRFVEPAPEGETLIHDEISDTYRIFIRALLTDNPYLLEKDPGYLKRLRLLPIADQRAKIHGDWWVFAGQVFTEWRDPFYGTKFPDEPDNACHVIDDFQPPAWMPRIVACDWGYNPGKTWVGWFAITPDRRAILYRERVWTKTNISVWGADVARISEQELDSIKACKLDPSAWGKRGEEKTIAEQIIEASGLPFDKADNDRIGGKALMHEYLRWGPKPPSYSITGSYDEEVAFKILRNEGPSKYREYTALFRPEEPETNLPRLLVCKSCTEFRKVIPACVYPEEEKPGIKAEDVAQFVGDDAYDGGRYGIKAVDDFFNLSSREAKKADKLSEIVIQLEQSGDGQPIIDKWLNTTGSSVVHQGTSRSTADNTIHKGSRTDYVFGLGKRQLIAEVLRLDAEVAYLKDSIGQVQSRYLEMVDANEDRLNSLIAKHTEIVDSKLGLGQPMQAPAPQESIKARRPWAEVQADYEAKRRKQFWEAKIAEVEAKDSNVSS